MKEKSTYILLFEGKEFPIPSQFQSLSDVDPEIFNNLIKKGYYRVKSNFNDKSIFQLFIDQWVYNKTPYFTQYNINSFKKLSKEFDRMKSLIQLVEANDKLISTSLYTNNLTLNTTLNDRKNDLNNINKKFCQINNTLFQNSINSQVIENKKMLLSQSFQYKLDSVQLLIENKVVEQDNLTYILNESEMVASLFHCESSKGKINVPYSITHQSKKYIITKIHKEAFKDNQQIIQIQFPLNSKIQSIENAAFANSSISQISIPSSVEQIGEYAFSSCKSLRKITFANKSRLKSIQNFAFYFSSIQMIEIPRSVELIGYSCFSHCMLNTIEFEEGSKLQYIGNNAFEYCDIEKISIPPKLKELQNRTFYNCEYLNEATFSWDSELQSIHSCAFLKTEINRLSLPSSIKELESKWCFGMFYLKSVKIQPRLNNFCYSNDGLFILGKSESKDSDVFDILVFANRKIQAATIPSFIKKIESCAFSDCKNLIKVQFQPQSKLEIIGDYSFAGTSIETILIPSNVVKIGNGAFSKCRKLNKIEFENESNLKKIGYSAFEFCGLKSVSIPSNITRIKHSTFLNCNLLKKVTFSDQNKLNRIDNCSFCSCEKIEEISIPSNVKKIGSNVFKDCLSLISVKFPKDSKLELIDDEAFSGTEIDYISIPKHVFAINRSAFENCNKLKKVDFSEDSEIEILGDQTFSGKMLTSISIPSSIVDYNAFCGFGTPILTNFSIIERDKQNIKIYKKFVFGKSDIKSDIFDVLVFACRDIKEAIIPPFIKKITSFSFSDCKSLKYVTFPSAVKVIDDFTFSDCYQLKGVTFSKESQLEVIKRNAFSCTYGSSEMTGFYISANVKQINFDSFFRSNANVRIIEISENSRLDIIKIDMSYVSSSFIVFMIPVEIKGSLKFDIKYVEDYW